jgi:hypothetical protein
LSYFGPTCFDGGDEDDCDLGSHVKPSKKIRFELIERFAARSMLDDSNFQPIWGGDGQSLANSIAQGNNFVIVTNDISSGEQFFLILCNKPLFTCQEDFTNGWSNNWKEGG